MNADEMLPGQVPDVLTPCAVPELYAALEHAWFTLFATAPSRASLLTLMAQTTEEDGWGARYCHAWNLGNVKHVDGDRYAWCAFRCTERLVEAAAQRAHASSPALVELLDAHDDGTRTVAFLPPHPACRFRAFGTLDEGAVDHLATLSRRFSHAWPAVLAGDPAAFARLLKEARYYTATAEDYARGLVALYRQLDRAIPDPSAPAPIATPLDLATVRGLQTALNALGASPALVVDGVNGPRTKAAVERWQAAHGLALDGLGGVPTQEALRVALAAL